MKRNILYMGCVLLGVVVGVMASAPLKAAVQSASFASVELFSGGSKRVGYIGPGSAGHGSLFLFNPEGGIEVQMGAYDSGSEKGQTLMGLHDKKGSLRLLMRLHGSQDSPVVVMKDKVGDDKLVFGLEGQDEMPYIKYRNKSGSMVNLIKD